MFADRINSPRHDAALEANGCSLERWEQPLSDLAARADAGTVVILAEPKYESTAASKAVDRWRDGQGAAGQAVRWSQSNALGEERAQAQSAGRRAWGSAVDRRQRSQHA